MSSNLLDGATVTRGTKDADGYWVLSQNDGTDKKDSPVWRIDGQPTLEENQTIHMACSVMPDEDWGSNAARMAVQYTDGAGELHWPTHDLGAAKAGVWTRLETEVVVPSGMRITQGLLTNAYKRSSGAKVTGVTISYGSPVVLASSAHTPYATQDHLRSEYATKAALKVTSDAVTAEVEERGKLAGRVDGLESTSSTHTSKLEQLATSIKSLVKGESTYTDPDGASATSGIYSLVTQTRDSVTALFGSYTKTEDLASTQAVKDAKKAGTDAQAAASAAQTTADSAKSTAQTAASDAATAKTNAASAVSTANSASTSAANAVETANAASSTASSASSTANSAASTANSAKSTADAAKTSAASAVSTANSASSTAGAAKSTADSLATMVRQYSGGVLVGKVGAGVCALVNADGSFDVVDVTWDGETPTVGDAITTLESNAARFFGGLAVISSEPFSDGRNLVLSHVGDEAQDMPLLSLSAFRTADINGKYQHEIVLYPGGNGAGIVHAEGPVYAQFGVYAPYDQGFVYTNPTVLFTGSYDYTKDHGVTLSEPASNFYLMTIIARGAYGVYDSVTVCDPDGKKVAFDIANVNGTHREHHSKVYQIQGQTIDTFNDTGYWEGKLVVDGGAVSQVSESCVGIVKVIGWRGGLIV